MAAIDWIKRVTNTAGRPCPLQGRACPGSAKECAFWIDESLRDALGNAELVSGCLMTFQYVMGHEVTDECKRTQVAVAQAASAVHGSVKGLAAVVAMKGDARGVLHSG